MGICVSSALIWWWSYYIILFVTPNVEQEKKRKEAEKTCGILEIDKDAFWSFVWLLIYVLEEFYKWNKDLWDW